MAPVPCPGVTPVSCSGVSDLQLEDLRKEKIEERTRWWELHEMTFGSHSDAEDEAGAGAKAGSADAKPAKKRGTEPLPPGLYLGGPTSGRSGRRVACCARLGGERTAGC